MPAQATPALQSLRSLDATAVGREFGRSAAWVYDHWQRLVAEKKLPPPVLVTGGLAWNAAQVYAVLDRGLTAEQRVSAAAYRAALTAALASRRDLDEDDAVAAARSALNARYAGPPARPETQLP